MPTKKSVKQAVSQAEHFRNDLTAMYECSLVSGLNAQVITDPGWGKTKLSLWMARQVFGNSGALLIECNPALQPDAIRGVTDIQAMIATGVARRILDSTPYDPAVMAVILDEVSRLSDIAYDLLIHATNEYLRDTRPVFWGTSNFATKGQRTEAFRDRFGLNLIPKLVMDDLTVQEVVSSPDISTWKFNLPTAEQITEVRSMQPTDKSLKAVSQIVALLFQTIRATEQGKAFVKSLNPRRIEAWKEILFRVSAFHQGTNDFGAISPEAASCMRFAWPVSDNTEYEAWVNLTGAVVDPAGTAIEAVRVAAYEKMVEIGNIKNVAERQAKMVELGIIKAEAEMQLANFGSDKRANEALADLQRLFVQYSSNQMVES